MVACMMINLLHLYLLYKRGRKSMMHRPRPLLLRSFVPSLMISYDTATECLAAALLFSWAKHSTFLTCMHALLSYDSVSWIRAENRRFEKATGPLTLCGCISLTAGWNGEPIQWHTALITIPLKLFASVEHVALQLINYCSLASVV